METRVPQESLGLTTSTMACPYEDKVVSDPTAARIILMFLRDFVEQKMVYAQNPQGFRCPMTKCDVSFNEPLLIIQHLLSCPELGKGEFECWKCCSWHRFPATEKEWSEWSGWKSTAPSFQRKRSLGSKMKETLTETLALRRRNSGRKVSISSTSSATDHNQAPETMLGSATAMMSSSILPVTALPTSPDVNGIVTTAQQPVQYGHPEDFPEWSQLLGLTSSQILSPQAVQELRTTFMVNPDLRQTFTQRTGNNLGMNADPITGAVSGYACAFDKNCFVADQHHHHRPETVQELAIKSENGTAASSFPAACSCNHFDSGSATSIALDDASAMMVWSTDTESSDASNRSSTRPSTTFDQSSSLSSSTNPSQGSLFVNQNLPGFSQETAHLIATGMTSGESRLSSDTSALVSAHLTPDGRLVDKGGGASSAFSPASTMRSDDHLTVTGSFASTPASVDIDQIDKAMEERHNWYHGQHMSDSVILTPPVSTDGAHSHFSQGRVVPAPSTATITTTASSTQHTSTHMENVSNMNHHQLANHASLGGLPSGSMDIDMDRDTHLSQPSLPSHQDSTSIFLQNPVAQGSGLLDSQQQQEEQQKHFQQQIPVNFQKSMSQLNNGSVHGGQYPSSANITAVTSTYGISDDDLHQPGSRPTSHHHHEDLTSSSRTSLQPPRTPASTIDEDIDPEDLVCDLCQWKPRGVRENLRGYLRKHKNVHKGLRLACDVPGCKKSFSRLDNLKTHRREKHSIDDTAPASKTTSTVSVDSASIIAGHHIATAGSNSLSVKRTMAMNEYANGGVMMAIPTTVVSTQPQHVLQAAANIAQAQAQARAQVRQAQLQAQAQHQVHVQAQAHAQFVQAQMQAQAAQEQAQQVQPEPPRPGSKRQRESLDHGYRGVTGEHAALWPLMQI